jgi:ribosomal protein S18 acetylase RimI-like enzyme
VANTNHIICNYRDNDLHRNYFFQFISKVFPSISFVEWYEKRFWTENYIPFSIIDSNKIIASASVSLMDILINGKQHKAAQIGAVGTLPEFRKQGLSRQLMNHIIEVYKEKVDFFFLYANDSVLNFYPKFGFKSIKENIFIAEIEKRNHKSHARKLDITNSDDYSLLLNLINNRLPITKLFGAEKYDFVTMWHILNIYRDNLYFLEEENAVIIKEEKNDTLHIYEVIHTIQFDLQSALPKIVESDSIKTVQYYFPPDQLKYEYSKVIDEDTKLFMLGNVDLREKTFRFPTTAVT